MTNDWYEPYKYCDPFIEWNEQKAYGEADRLSALHEKERDKKKNQKELLKKKNSFFL